MNCAEAEKKRPRCKSLKCPMYFEHLEEDKKMDKLMSTIKVFAKNNMCASCFSDVEKFVSVMEDIINGMLGNEIDCSLTKKQEAIFITKRRCKLLHRLSCFYYNSKIINLILF